MVDAKLRVKQEDSTLARRYCFIFLRKSPVYKGFWKCLILGTTKYVVTITLGFPVITEKNCNNYTP